MKDKLLKRIKAIENQTSVEIEDISGYEREIFGADESDVMPDEEP